MVAPEPADLALHSAFLVRAFHAGLAPERVEAHMGSVDHPTFVLGAPTPATTKYPGDGGFQVVVPDMPGWHPSNMRVSLSSLGFIGGCA